MIEAFSVLHAANICVLFAGVWEKEVAVREDTLEHFLQNTSAAPGLCLFFVC